MIQEMVERVRNRIAGRRTAAKPAEAAALTAETLESGFKTDQYKPALTGRVVDRVEVVMTSQASVDAFERLTVGHAYDEVTEAIESVRRQFADSEEFQEYLRIKACIAARKADLKVSDDELGSLKWQIRQAVEADTDSTLLEARRDQVKLRRDSLIERHQILEEKASTAFTAAKVKLAGLLKQELVRVAERNKELGRAVLPRLQVIVPLIVTLQKSKQTMDRVWQLVDGKYLDEMANPDTLLEEIRRRDGLPHPDDFADLEELHKELQRQKVLPAATD